MGLKIGRFPIYGGGLTGMAKVLFQLQTLISEIRQYFFL